MKKIDLQEYFNSDGELPSGYPVSNLIDGDMVFIKRNDDDYVSVKRKDGSIKIFKNYYLYIKVNYQLV